MEVITTASWIKVAIITTRQAVKADHTLWRRMHFEDWDKLPRELMEAGLANLLKRYGQSLTIHWHGRGCNLPLGSDPATRPGDGVLEHHQVTGTNATRSDSGTALTDVSSPTPFRPSRWLSLGSSIRAINVNVDGSRDIGRRALRLRPARHSEVACPWPDRFCAHGGRVPRPLQSSTDAEVRFQIMLDEADRDLDLAIRAYNQRYRRALRGEGQEYLESVKRRRRRFIRNDGTSRAWRFLNEPRRNTKLAAEKPEPEATRGESVSSRASGQPAKPARALFRLRQSHSTKRGGTSFCTT